MDTANLIDRELALSLLPKREKNSNKGSFGRLLTVVGSGEYLGAAHLAIESALRGGVGSVKALCEERLLFSLLNKYPEVIYQQIPPVSSFTEREAFEIAEASQSFTAVLVGSGSGRSVGLLRLVVSLLKTEGAPVILDADAINVLSELKEEGRELLRRAKREVILTPHPLEFSRLSGLEVGFVNEHRAECAENFVKQYGSNLVLKGAGTVVTDGKKLYINTTGSSALAKAGSGDCLAGLIASLVGSGVSPISAAALGAYIHGAAGDALAKRFSEFGVTPSDLPSAMAEELAKLQN